MNLAYASIGNEGGFILEVDRNGRLLQVRLTSPHGETICAEFSESDAEEIASSFAYAYREIRKVAS